MDIVFLPTGGASHFASMMTVSAGPDRQPDADSLSGRPGHRISAKLTVSAPRGHDIQSTVRKPSRARSHRETPMRGMVETFRKAEMGWRAPRVARRISAIGIRDIPASAVEIGDDLLIVPGDRFPCDGIIVEGNSDVGRSVLRGIVNRAGALRMRATSGVSPRP